MADTSAPLTSFSTGDAAAPSASAVEDPLAGDWSEGLPEPVRALDVPLPQRIVLGGAPAGAAAVAPSVDAGARSAHGQAIDEAPDRMSPATERAPDAAADTPSPEEESAPPASDDFTPPASDDLAPPAWAEPVPAGPSPWGEPAHLAPDADAPSSPPNRSLFTVEPDQDIPSVPAWVPAAPDQAALASETEVFVSSARDPVAEAPLPDGDSAPTPWSEPVPAPPSPAAWEEAAAAAPPPADTSPAPRDGGPAAADAPAAWDRAPSAADAPTDASTAWDDAPAADAVAAAPPLLVPPAPPVIPPPVLVPTPPVPAPTAAAAAPPPVPVPSPPVLIPTAAAAPPPPVRVFSPPVLIPTAAAAPPPPVLVPSPPVLIPTAAAAAPPPVLVPSPPVLSPSPPVLVPSAPEPHSIASDAVPTAPDTAWDAPPPAAASTPEWEPESAASDWQPVKSAEAPAPESARADWSSLRGGPDWAAAASPEPAADAWGAPPPAAEPAAAWEAVPAPAPADADWSPPPPAAPVKPEWSPPGPLAQVAAEEPASRPGPAWNAPAVGASALEQLESEPPEPEPGAAKELFGSVPAGGSLSGDDDELSPHDGLGANDEMAPADLGPPVELVSPEEVLRPLDDIDHDDPDLPAALEPAAPSRPRAQPLAALRPAATGALEVHGEHRVAVHTRGGRTLRGSLRDIDLSKSQFPLLPQGGGDEESIYHSDVKAIFFMLAPGEKPHPGDGAKVRVTFADGRVIEGTREGPDAKHGFFLVPTDAARTNTRRIYVAREATSEIANG